MRTARYWTLGEAEGAAEVWFVLHGYKQLARRFLRRFEPIHRPGRLVVAPEGLSRFYVSSGGGRHGADSVVGASWMTREDRLVEIDDYVAYLDRLAQRVLSDVIGDAATDGASTAIQPPAADADPGAWRPETTDGTPSVTVLGFSQGVATASRWVTLGSVEPDRLVLWGDFLPPDLDMPRAEQALDGVDLVLVRGSEDPALSPDLAAEEMERLDASTLRPRGVEYRGGHEIDEETLRSLASGEP